MPCMRCWVCILCAWSVASLPIITHPTTPAPCPLPRKLSRLASALRSASSPQERLLRLIRIGEKLPRASVAELGSTTRVIGCTSVVHVLASRGSDGALILSGAADSKIARGLLGLVVRGSQGEKATVLVDLNGALLADKAALHGVFVQSRLNGLDNIIEAIRSQVHPEEQEATQDSPRDEAELREETAPPAADSTSNNTTKAASIVQVYVPPASAKEEVAVLLSGGVDSSVALHSLLDAGYCCRAFYLRIWLEDEQQHAARGECPWEEDWRYCTEVCRKAGVPLESVSLQEEYSDYVVRYLIDEAAAGRTPNPDIMCNSRIKFGVFSDRVGRYFKHIASGHYAQSAPMPGSPSGVQLLRSADVHKDQTYFLSQLRQDQLAPALFPIGSMTKEQVRVRAQELDLPNRARKDSQGICFLGQLNYDDFIFDHLGENPGEILEYETGQQIGTHRGLWFHTVGQRRGLGPVLSNAFRAKGPWHVVRKNIEGNVLYASKQYAAVMEHRDAFFAEAMNWVAGKPPAPNGATLQLQVKTRHGAHVHDAEVLLSARGAHVSLATRDKGLAPGQFAAFYDGEVCLGSGIISEAEL